MKRVRLENVDISLKEQLKNPRFQRLYEFECAKVSLAQKIAELREDQNMNQADLAKKLGVSQQFISQIETGEGSNLTLGTLIKLAQAFHRKLQIQFV